MSTATAVPPVAPRTSPALLDLAIAGVAFAGTLVMLHHGGVTPAGPDTPKLDAVGVALAACATAPLLAWRRFPLAVFAATAGTSVLLAALSYPVDLILGPTAALYLLSCSRERQHPWTSRTTATVVGLLVAYLAAASAARQTFPATELLHTGLAWSVAWFAGERTRLRREQFAELNARAERAERDAHRERLLAVAEERARIARDLHDSTGHAISVIAVRAGAARLRHGQEPDRSLAALQAIEDLARRTAEDLDQMVGTLREPQSPDGIVEAPAALSSLDTLIAHHANTGLTTSVEVSGDPRPLGGVADQAAYRIVQEALTNAARHGTGSARIALGFGDAAVELTITNPVAGNGQPRPGGGHGLIGMRERATIIGGTMDVERTDGVFQVRARLPYGGHRT